MSDIQIDLASSEQICEKILARAKESGVESSEIHDAGSNEALNAPLAGAEIIIAAKVITAVFVAATAIVKFLREVRNAMDEREAVAVRSQAGQRLVLNSRTSDDEIDRFA